MSAFDLDRLQRWMQTVIMHPDGPDAGVQSPAARGHIDLQGAEVDRVVTPSSTMPAIERIAVYGRAYYARLLDCMQQEFPILRQTVGEEAFDAFAFGYLQRYPSTSYTLGRLSGRFPQYLEETRPDDEDGNELPGWSDFIIDLSRFEWTIADVFDGPGVETCAPLAATDLLQIPPEVWPTMRLVAAPCLRLLNLRFPVGEFYQAVRRQEQPVVSGPAPSAFAVTRQNYVVRWFPLSPPQFALLHALLSGESIGDALRACAGSIESDPAQFSQTLRAWFTLWTSEAFFVAVTSDE